MLRWPRGVHLNADHELDRLRLVLARAAATGSCLKRWVGHRVEHDVPNLRTRQPVDVAEVLHAAARQQRLGQQSRESDE
eukprot:10691305-Lingulodinium_polyedra.AAC.1